MARWCVTPGGESHSRWCSEISWFKAPCPVVSLTGGNVSHLKKVIVVVEYYSLYEILLMET